MPNIGMCPALSDREYFNLMTKNGEDKNCVAITLSYYPELVEFVKR